MIPTLLRRALEPLSKVTSSATDAATISKAPEAEVTTDASKISTAPVAKATNPYQARKVWPPNFSELSPQHQLRLEKKYKRRLILAHSAPRWQKAVKYAQFASLTGQYALEHPHYQTGLRGC